MQSAMLSGLRLAAAFVFVGCSSSSSGNGAQSLGGGASPGTGGAFDSGGSSSAGDITSGGALNTGGNNSGGAQPTGGNMSGGAQPTGGSISVGGTTSSGGNPATGGFAQTGGKAAVGGAPTGGKSTIGGASATGGSKATGGLAQTGGGVATGGAVASGGTSIGTSGGTTGATSTGTGNQAQVRWIGRVDASNAAAVKFAWSGTGFIANVQGSKISVRLQSESSAAFFQPVIDGTAGQRFQVATGAAQTVVLGNNLSAATHTVELYRETEGMYGDSVFMGFIDGTLVAAPAAPGRLIEVIGDSISAGYGNLGVEVHPPWDNTCSFTLDTESAYQAYSFQLARSLHADVSIIARSGWGMVRDNSGNTTGVLSSVYSNTLGVQASPAWNFAAQPNAVVINLGTNDSSPGDPGQAYETAYVSFLKTVRSHHPNAWIFITIGSMTGDSMLTTMRTHLANVVTAASDAKVVKVDIDVQDSTSTGCDYHPNVPEDTRIAKVLETALAAKLGW